MWAAGAGGVAMGRLGVPSNLPAELSTFVGRADDLQRGARLPGESRLVTFTGAGGCGKTRLARQVAARVAERFPGGVWWVELASLADGALVTDRGARTLGLQAGGAAPRRHFFRPTAPPFPPAHRHHTPSRVPPTFPPVP